MGKRGPKKGQDPWNGRGNWKTASYSRERELVVEWMATPTPDRDPKTQVALSKTIGVSTATISNWIREPAMVRRSYQAMAKGIVNVDLSRVLAVQVQVATDPDNRSSTTAARLLLEFARHALDEGESSVNYQELSDADLRKQLVDVLDEFDDRLETDLEDTG